MSSLLIKIVKNGTAKEYHLNTLGPVTIGSDKQCDICIDNSEIESKILEVKLSAGAIFITPVSSKSAILVNATTSIYRQCIPYKDGECITINNTNYQIFISKMKDDSIAPPPFFEEEFNERLSRMDLKIREKDLQIQKLEDSHNIKSGQLHELENSFKEINKEKLKIEKEINLLNLKKEALSEETRLKHEINNHEQTKSDQLNEHIRKTKEEERVIQDKIHSQNRFLENLQKSHEDKEKEINQQRFLISNIQKELADAKNQLCEITLEHKSREEEIKNDNLKIQNILIETEAAKTQSLRVQEQLATGIKGKVKLEYEYRDLQSEVEKLQSQKRDFHQQLNDLQLLIEKEESNSKNIIEEIHRKELEDKNLLLRNEEIKNELISTEVHLSNKKGNLNQLEFLTKDVERKLSTINHEIEKSTFKLNELKSEERSQELKILNIREELNIFGNRAKEDKNALIKNIEDEKERLNLKNLALSSQIKELEKAKGLITSECETLQNKVEDLNKKIDDLSAHKAELSLSINELAHKKAQYEMQSSALKNDNAKLEQDKNKINNDLVQLQLKLAKCESTIKEREERSKIEIEEYKREERSKLSAEKNIQLLEIDNYRRKSIQDIESVHRKEQTDIHLIKSAAHLQAEEILNIARNKEVQITQEANERLKKATADAQERESFSHKRINDAQEFFKLKESEAEAIISKARLESRELINKTENQVLEELTTRKSKIKKFLNMKQDAGVTHLKSLNEQAAIRIKRAEEKAIQKLEDLKRKELKKVAKIREEELEHQLEMKKTALKAFKLEKERTVKELQDLKIRQETELADKKKSVVDHINSIKMDNQKTWEEEIKREKELFLMSKKERISNATQAVMNVLISESASLAENELVLRQKILSSLEMAIDGQNAHAINKVGQILDFNPLKRKKFIPVFQKYSVQFGIPAVIAITLLFDIGSLRTILVNQTSSIAKNQYSSAEAENIKQKKEWRLKNSFNPPLVAGYKTSFTDNVIYTPDFEKIMDNEAFQNDWILKVHDFLVKDLELPEDVAISYISSEGALIKDLGVSRKDLHPLHLDQGLAKMKAQEETHLGWLKQKITKPEDLDKFFTFRKNYFDNYASEKEKSNRSIATEKK